MNNNSITKSVKISPELEEAVEKFLTANDTNFSQLVRKALIQYIGDV